MERSGQQMTNGPVSDHLTFSHLSLTLISPDANSIAMDGSSDIFSGTVQGVTPGRGGSAKCSVCKGRYLMCGKDRCPVLVKYHAITRSRPAIDGLELDGASPPGVFIGRFGYPKVMVGPLIPPDHGDTTVMDTPEMWRDITMEGIVDFRSRLVRGMHKVEITNVEGGGRIVDATREMAMSGNPSEAEAIFDRRPMGKLSLDDEVQPFGPSAPLRALSVGNLKIDQRIDKAYSDTDLLSTEAVVNLYKSGTLVSRIQKAFSVGAFGLGRNRKFVPTRWSITAVDDILGKEMLRRTKRNPLINGFRVYDYDALDNRWCVIFMPTSWRYELIEAWYPKTVWNPYGSDVEICSSHEFFEGRKTYAEIGGCYYAARMAVNEVLDAERRQAGAVILRESHPGYIMPVGVWNVRENVRNALRRPPSRFDTLNEALDHVSKRMDIPPRRWINNSAILKDVIQQRRIEDFLVSRSDALERMPEEPA